MTAHPAPAGRAPPGGRLRVAQVVTRMDIGGVPDHIMTLVRGLRASMDVTIVCNAIDPVHQGELASLGVPVRLLPMKRLLAPLADLRGLMRLVGLFRAEGFDVVHTHMSKAALLGGVAARLARTPASVNTAHNLGSLAMPGMALRALFRVYDSLLLRLTADTVITVADRVKTGIETRRIVPAAKLASIHNGIDTQRFTVPCERAGARRQELGVAKGDLLVVTVARLVWFKGLDTLIAAAAKVLERHPQARFVIVGDGPQRAELEKQARDLGVAERVGFTGERRDVADILAASDLFVLSSVSEGLPVSILEAMASGRAVVATDVGGVAELVDDGRTGLVVPARDADALAAAILRLVADPACRREMGKAGLERVREHFSTRQMVERTASLYRRLLAARPAAARTAGKNSDGR